MQARIVQPLFNRCLFASVFALIAMPVSADCPLQKTQISGQVQSRDEQPIEGARITATWDELRSNDVSAESRSNADGSFELNLSIDSFGGRSILGKEQCDFQLKSLKVSVRHDNYREVERKLKPKDMEESLNIEMRAR